MRDILEEIAQNDSNRSAQIQAIRLLRELDDGDETPEGFAELDQEVPRIRRKAA
jgi:hypothetical protein